VSGIGPIKTLSTSPTAALIGLGAVTAVWGSTFVLMKDAITRQPVLDFLATRFALAAVCMIIVRPSCLRRLDARGWLRAGLLGLALGSGYIAQTFGLAQTTAAISGFITGMFVVFTPLIGALLLKKHVGTWRWFGVALATVGLAVISIRGWSMGIGEALTLLCALLFAIHIVGLGEWSKGEDPYALAVVQIGTVALICGIGALGDGYQPPPDLSVWIAIAITAILATAVAFLVQTWAQSLIDATRAAVVMTMEPVFAGAFAVLLGGEVLGLRTLLGGALVVCAMYVVQLGPRSTEDAPVLDPLAPRLEP
jgi:drug/metabolite transporter (DMT)-like permease